MSPPAPRGLVRVLPRVLVAATTLSYTLNVALGLAATRRRVPPRFHALHHAAYVSTCCLGAAAVSTVGWTGSRAGWRLLPAAVPLSVIPSVRARSRLHPVIALSVAPFLLASLVEAIQEQHGVP